VSIQLAVQIEIIARKFSMHFECVPLIFTLAEDWCCKVIFSVKIHRK